jgi:Peptidase family M23
MRGRCLLTRRALYVVSVLAGLMSSVSASGIELSLPIDCTPGNDCWVAYHVDVAAGPEVRDFACGRRTYDDHKGVDFAIRDFASMQRGVAVLASAPGVVNAARDGMTDINFRAADPKLVVKRECGNGVLLDHGDGWTTQYCHMRRGSVAVKRGQRVTAGQALGKVGLSGKTTYPHVHFQTKHDGKVIDPFLGVDRAAGCGAAPVPIWTAEAARQLRYRPVEIYNSGISNYKPDAEAIRNGTFLPWLSGLTDDAVYLWADVFGMEAGDAVVFTLRDGGGKVLFEQTRAASKRGSRGFLYFGRKVAGTGRMQDRLSGTVTIKRRMPDGVYTDRRTVGPPAR